VSRRRDRERLRDRLQEAWAVTRGEAERAGSSLDGWDLCDVVLDLVESESISPLFLDELRQRRLSRIRDRAAARGRERRRIVCVSCGVPFGAWRSDARYCGPACRQRAHRALQAHRVGGRQ